MKKKPDCSETGKEKRTSYRAVYLQRHVYSQEQVHEQWKLFKTNGKFKNDSDLAAYLISLEFRRQAIQATAMYCQRSVSFSGEKRLGLKWMRYASMMVSVLYITFYDGHEFKPDPGLPTY